MGKEITGIVIEKTYRPPLGAMGVSDYCYLMVEAMSGERVSIRLHRKVHDKITIGDKIRFSKPWRKKKRVGDVQVIGRARIV